VAIGLALQTSPVMTQARGNVSNAAWQKRTVIGSWLPSLNLSSGLAQQSSSQFNPTTQQTVTSSSTSYSATLSASVALFSGFRRIAQGRAAGAEAASAEAGLIASEFQTILQTKQAFFAALAAAELLRVSEIRLQRAQEQLQITRDKLANGTAIRSDTLGSVVEFGNAQLQLLTAQTSLATSEANLAAVIGITGSVSAVGDSTFFTPVQLDTAQLREMVMLEAPTIVQSEALTRSAQANLSVARAQYFPTVNASFSNAWAGREISAINSSWSLRLSANWPLFNGFTREANAVRNAVALDVARAQEENNRRQVNADLTQYFAALAAAETRHAVAVASIAAAQEQLRIEQERYRLGATTIVEVLTIQGNREQAEVDRIQALFDYLVAKAQIESLIGREL
jgi:outer membrane protein TolC